jgi:hypothetical protein
LLLAGVLDRLMDCCASLENLGSIERCPKRNETWQVYLEVRCVCVALDRQ